MPLYSSVSLRRVAPSAAALLAAVACVAPAAADSESQVIPFDFFINQAPIFPEIELFDTMNGTRTLDGVTLTYDQRVTFDVLLEQNSPVAIPEGDFFIDILYRSIHQLGTVDDGGGDDDDDDDGGSGPPFLGPGAAGDVYSPGFAPSDGFNGTGPDSFSTSFDSGLFTFSSSYASDGEPIELSFIETLTGEGSLTTVFGGLVELFGGYNTQPDFPDVDPNNPPPGNFGFFEDPYYGVFLEYNNLRHQGDITVTYDFSVVPEPTSAAALAFGGLLLRRRR